MLTRAFCAIALALGALLGRDGTAHDLAASPAQGGPGSGPSDPALDAAPRPARWVAWSRALAAVDVVGASTGAHAAIRLYDDEGSVDGEALARFEATASSGEPRALSQRLVQLVVNSSYRFSNARVVVVSGWRERAGRHSTGEAVDFKLEGVPAATLAASLRALPRAGVGVYTHPKTQYVHLDVREPSYHWVDASPPGVTWKERMLPDPGQAERDASWTADDDLP